jgi:hypothetical protein
MPTSYQFRFTFIQRSHYMPFVRIVRACVSVALFVLMAGCAKEPNQAIAEAKIAFETAKAVNAEELAKADFESAKEAFETAMNEIQVENKKLPFFRNYKNAANLLTEAKGLGERATNFAKAEKERMLTEQENAQIEESKKKAGKAKGKKFNKK